MPYILDTNIFIEAKDGYYMFDICPGFWDWLIMQNKDGVVYSVSAVNMELKKGKDDLSQWSAGHGNEFFLLPNSSTENAMAVVSAKVQKMNYDANAINEFFNSADYYVVAEAYARKYTVVTREILSNTQKKIKIPNICKELKIDCVDTFKMLRDKKARFVLDYS